jgi:serine/threonine-protein kinase
MHQPVEQRKGLIIGRYALHGEIASGGMATVHFGRFLGPAGFSRIVAIKRLHPQLAKESEFVSMFLDEVRLAARIQHPNVVPTIDAVEENGELFLVMEYVHGESLSRLIRMARSRGRTIPPPIAATIICGLLHGLHAAHDAKCEEGKPLEIVHRDVSPQNVLVGFDGIARVLDFGIAKAVGRLQTTREGQIKGKMAYLAPEHVRGGPIDRRTDVYGAAVVLWETLTGVRLFDGENDAIVLAKVLAEPVPPLSAFVEDLPPALEAITLKGLDRNPENRFNTARDMALAIQREVGTVAPCEVGDWVSELAEEHLSTRSRYLAELERLAMAEREAYGAGRFSSTPPPSSDQPPISGVGPARGGDSPSSMVPAAALSTFDGTTEPVAKRRRRVPATWLLITAGLAATIVLWMVAHRPNVAASPVIEIDDVKSAGAPVLPPAEPPEKPVGIADAPRPQTALTAPNEPAVAVPAKAPATPPKAPRPAAAAVVSRSTPVASPLPAATNAACHPPYTIDAQGIKHFKVECL